MRPAAPLTNSARAIVALMFLACLGANASAAPIALDEPLAFTAPGESAGLAPLQWSDGRYRVGFVGGKRALQTDDLYIYFNVSDDKLHDLPRESELPLVLVAEIFDARRGRLDVQYDAHPLDPDRAGASAWTTTESVRLTGDGQWRTFTFQLPRARLANRQHGKADLRFRMSPNSAIALHTLALREAGDEPAAGAGKEKKKDAPAPKALTGVAPQLPIVGQLELEPPAEHGGYFAFAFSPDGRWVAGGTGVGKVTGGGKTRTFGGEVLLWNARTGRLVRTLGSHGASVRLVAFANGGRTLLSASRDNGRIAVWNLSTGRAIQTFDLDAELASDTHFSPLVAISGDGRTVAAVTKRTIPAGGNSSIALGGDLTVWDARTGRERWSLGDSGLVSLAFSPDDRRLAGQIKHVARVENAEGRTMFRQSMELVVYDAIKGDVQQTLDVNLRTAQLEHLDRGRTLAALGFTGMASIDLQTGEVREQFRWHDDRRSCDAAVFSRDGRWLLRCDNEYIELLDLENERVAGLLEASFSDAIWHAAPDAELKRVACQRNHKPVVLMLGDPKQ